MKKTKNLATLPETIYVERERDGTYLVDDTAPENLTQEVGEYVVGEYVLKSKMTVRLVPEVKPIL